MNFIQMISFSFSVVLISLSQLFAVNPVGVSGPTYQIGQYAQGGVVFWLTPDRRHGLVASIEDMSGSGNTGGVDPDYLFAWGPDVLVGSELNDLSRGFHYETAGMINTKLFLSMNFVPTPPALLYAAQGCAAYSVTVDGVTYDDWYLPSLSELQMMLARKAVIDEVSIAHGGSGFYNGDDPDNGVYWSSTETNYFQVLNIRIFNGGYEKVGIPKFTKSRIRACRAF